MTHVRAELQNCHIPTRRRVLKKCSPECTGHMGYTFRFCSAGGVDAVESEFANGRAPSLCRPASGWGRRADRQERTKVSGKFCLVCLELLIDGRARLHRA